MIYIQLFAFLVLIAASCCDVRTMRIPNILTFSSFILISAMLLFVSNLSGQELCNRFLTFLLLFLVGPVLEHYMGLGDLKLFMLSALVLDYKCLIVQSISSIILFLLFQLTLEYTRNISCSGHFRNALSILTGKQVSLSLSTKYPFAPYIAAGYAVAILTEALHV